MTGRPSRSRAFFLELVLDLVVFALCAIISIQVFIEAQLTSDKSVALSHLTIEAQVMAETFKACDGDVDDMVAVLEKEGNVSVQRQGSEPLVVRYFDDSFVSIDDEDIARYRIDCTVDDSQVLKKAYIVIYDKDSELFSFEAKRYTKNSSAYTIRESGV